MRYACRDSDVYFRGLSAREGNQDKGVAYLVELVNVFLCRNVGVFERLASLLVLGAGNSGLMSRMVEAFVFFGQECTSLLTPRAQQHIFIVSTPPTFP